MLLGLHDRQLRLGLLAVHLLGQGLPDILLEELAKLRVIEVAFLELWVEGLDDGLGSGWDGRVGDFLLDLLANGLLDVTRGFLHDTPLKFVGRTPGVARRRFYRTGPATP